MESPNDPNMPVVARNMHLSPARLALLAVRAGTDNASKVLPLVDASGSAMRALKHALGWRTDKNALDWRWLGGEHAIAGEFHLRLLVRFDLDEADADLA